MKKLALIVTAAVLAATGAEARQTPTPASVSAEQPTKFVQVGRLLADPASGRVLRDKTLVIRGNQIVEIRDGFVGEGKQPAELGWGTHERHFPADGHRHRTGSKAAIYLARPGASVRVRSWTPLEGPYHGFLITHNESISIADYLTVGAGDAPTYRPTVHYAYHPADDAVLSVHELAGKNWQMQSRVRLIVDEITTGVDELGVLLAGHAKGAYWYGSQLTIEEARACAPHNNATSLQVTVAVLAGIVWALENPGRWVTEPEDMDFERILEIARPYLGKMVGAYSDWTPLLDLFGAGDPIEILIWPDADKLMKRPDGVEIDRHAFRFRTDNQIVFWEAIRAGNGIGFAQEPLVMREETVDAILPQLALPVLPMWLAMHRDVRTSPRIRRVADFLHEELKAYALSPSTT